MNLVVTILRLLHIVAAFAWFGLGFTMTLYIGPAAAAAGESGLRFMRSLLVNTRFATVFAAVAGVTMLMGLLLYVTGDPNTSFSRTGQIVLGIGALVGLAAGIHGGAVTGRATTAYGKALAQYPADQPIPADGITALRQQAMDVASKVRVSFWLMVVALIAMGGARYL